MQHSNQSLIAFDPFYSVAIVPCVVHLRIALGPIHRKRHDRMYPGLLGNREGTRSLPCLHRAANPQECPVALVNFIKPEINFKRVTERWVFRAPNPWIFGKSPHYLVSDDQRSQIIAIVRSAMVPVPIMVAIALVVVVSLAVFWKLDDIGFALLMVVAGLVCISGLAAIQRWRLKPILADASLTNERITYAEMRKADEDLTPLEQVRGRWMWQALLCVGCFLPIINNWTRARPAAAIFFTFAWFVFAWQAVRWYRVKRHRAKQEQ
jgi:hypothetical protein